MQEGLRTHRILDHVRLELLDSAASPQRVGKVKALMEIDHPIALFADALPAGLGVPDYLIHPGSTVEGVAAPHAGRVDAKNAIAGFHGVGRPLSQAAAPAAARGVALDVVAVHPSQEVINGVRQGLACDVPQGHVQGPQGMDLLSPGRIEKGAIHVLPAVLDRKGVPADQAAGALFERVARAAVADSDQLGVGGLDGDHHVALIENGIEVGRRIDSDPADGQFRQRCFRGLSGRRLGQGDCTGCDKRFESRSPIHSLPPFGVHVPSFGDRSPSSHSADTRQIGRGRIQHTDRCLRRRDGSIERPSRIRYETHKVFVLKVMTHRRKMEGGMRLL